MVSVKQDSATHNMICLLREWDRAPKEKRRKFLQDFIDQHRNRSGPELETEMAQMASLFLARICVWIKLTYMSGTCLTEQLQALHIFLSASAGHSFLLEFLEHGGVLCLQELCVSSVSKEMDKLWALKVLSCVAKAGTRYKEAICECYGIRAVAECMAKSTSEETQLEARNLLETLAEGNPKFADHVYKGFIGVLPCNSSKAQQLALQSIRILQASRDTANRALIDRIIYLLESLHLEVQSAVIELVRDLMRFDIADDILAALVSLLRPQREIQLGKLLSQDASNSDVSSCVGSESEDGESSGTASDNSTGVGLGDNTKPKPVSRTTGTVAGRKPKLVLSDSVKKRSHKAERTKSVSTMSSVNSIRKKKKPPCKRSDQHMDMKPLPAFVQQTAAANCIRILAQDSTVLAIKLLKFGSLSNLLYAMGNLEHPDGQRQAALALQFFCDKFPTVDEIVRETMGPALYDEFRNIEDSYHLQLTPLQADVLVSNKVTYHGEDLEMPSPPSSEPENTSSVNIHSRDLAQDSC